MIRFAPLRAVAAFVLVAAAASGAIADGVVVRTTRAPGSPVWPVSTPAPGPAPVYGGFTTPASGSVYGPWTTPQPPPYGSFTTPPPGGYGTWTTPPGSARAVGARAMPSFPSSLTVTDAPPGVGGYGAASTRDPAFGCGTRGCGPRADVDCSPWSFGAWQRAWRPTVEGEVLITRGGVPGSGSAIDVDRDLGLSDDAAFEFGAFVAYGRHRVFAAWESLTFEGTNRLDRPIVYRAVAFSAAEEIRSHLELTYVKAGWDYALIEPAVSDSTRFELRAGVAAWWWTYDGRIRGETTSVDRKFSHVLPIATVSGSVALDAFHGSLRASGGLVAGDRYIVDLEAAVGVTLWDSVGLDVGWRWMNHSFHETTNEADLTFSGPFAGLSVVF